VYLTTKFQRLLEEGHLTEGLEVRPQVRGRGLVHLQLEPPALLRQVDPVKPVVRNRESGKTDPDRLIVGGRFQLDVQPSVGVRLEDEASEVRLPPEPHPDGGQALARHVRLQRKADPLSAVVIDAGMEVIGIKVIRIRLQLNGLRYATAYLRVRLGLDHQRPQGNRKKDGFLGNRLRQHNMFLLLPRQ